MPCTRCSTGGRGTCRTSPLGTTAAVPMAETRGLAVGWSGAAAASVWATEVALMTYDTADIAGPLRVEGRWSLAEGTWLAG